MTAITISELQCETLARIGNCVLIKVLADNTTKQFYKDYVGGVHLIEFTSIHDAPDWLREAFEESWRQNEAAYRYLAER